jgi:hypothetical protein
MLSISLGSTLLREAPITPSITTSGEEFAPIVEDHEDELPLLR